MQLKVELRKMVFQHQSRVVLLDDINDPYTPLEKELEGAVRFVDDIGTVHVKWDNGSCLGACLEDKIAKV
jgi:hypothetical protein